MRGSSDSSLFTVRARNGEPADPQHAIFPLFRVDDGGSLHVLGTGFFISEFGLFVSAKHVFREILDDRDRPVEGIAIIQFIEGHTFYPRPVDAFVVHEQADVGVGVCAAMKHKMTGEPLRNKILTLSRTMPRVGDTVWTYAYPGTIVQGVNPQAVTIDPNFYVGQITEYFPGGRDRTMLPAPCYRTSIVLHGGSSGGPVFGPGGNVIGVNSTGYEGQADISFVSRVADVLRLGIRDVEVAGEGAPRTMTIKEMADLGHVSYRSD